MPIHIAITRRVRPGCEAEFQHALREFFQTSFAHGGVWGASWSKLHLAEMKRGEAAPTSPLKE